MQQPPHGPPGSHGSHGSYGSYGYYAPPPMPPPRKPGMSAGAIVGIVLACAFGGCAMLGAISSSASKRQAAGSAEDSTKRAGPSAVAEPKAAAAKPAKEPPPPAIPVTAKALAAAYEANEVAADERWKGKRVAVTGTVRSINKDFIGDIFVVLSEDPFELQAVQASVKKSEKAAASRLAKGQKATLTCKVSGRILTSVMLRDCTLGAAGDGGDDEPG